jgi:tetratricopeptide (TPR) repeat protein
LAATGKADGALAELDRLAGTARFRREATLAKVGVLLGARRLADAEAILTELTKSAVDQKDTTALRATAELYSRLGRHDKALAVCDQLEALAPTDPRTPQLRAMVLLEAKRPAEAADSYRKAIELQPQNISLHLELARTLDEDQRFTEALEVLLKLADAGPAAASVALFQEGALYARWGLQDQAADCFAKLSGMGYGGNPGVRLALGRAFAALGQLERAGDSLG